MLANKIVVGSAFVLVLALWAFMGYYLVTTPATSADARYYEWIAFVIGIFFLLGGLDTVVKTFKSPTNIQS